MTRTLFRLTTACSMLAALFAIGVSSARADHFSSMHSHAKTLESNAERVEREVDAHFSGLPFSAALKADVCEMAQLAEHIHDLTDEHASPRHIQADLRVLDAKFHSIEDVVANLRRLASGRGECRHARPNEYYVRRLSDRVAEMGRTLHCMQDTLALMLRECDHPVHSHHDSGHHDAHPSSRVHFDGHSLHIPASHKGSSFFLSIRLR